MEICIVALDYIIYSSCFSRGYTLYHFLAGARDTPDRLPGDFCHQAVEEWRKKKSYFNFVKNLKEPSWKWEKPISEVTFCGDKLILKRFKMKVLELYSKQFF